MAAMPLYGALNLVRMYPYIYATITILIVTSMAMYKEGL